jgi:RNA polymerase sigma-70 factor (ECF subfamily)
VGADQERTWVLQTLNGDQDAFARLVDAYKGPVYNLAYRMLGNSADAEDATQEVFLRAYTKLETYDPARKFSSWILSVGSHYCVDRLRRRRGEKVSMDEIQGWRWIPDGSPRPEERATRSEMNEAVRRVLETLPEQYRLVIALRYWHDRSYTEIAEITDSTESAVKSRLHRARRMMAELLQESPDAAEYVAGSNEWRGTENALSQCF